MTDLDPLAQSHRRASDPKRPPEIREPAVLLNLNRLYRPDMTQLELYEATRGFWRIGPRRDQVELALAVFQGVVREVFEVERWLPAGTLSYTSRDASPFRGSGRWEFEGRVAGEARARYIGLVVGPGTQNPVRLLNLRPK